MKILSILNVSNRDNPGSDSGVIFHKIFFEELQKFVKEITIASPFEFDVKGVGFNIFEPGKNKYDVRFRFDWDKYKELIEKVKPDIIFCHQVEQCTNLRALLVSMGLNQKVKLVAYYHYLPAMEIVDDKIIWDPSLNHSGLAETILLKIISSIKTSDLFFVTSEYSKNFIIKLTNYYNITIPVEKIAIIPPPIDPFFEKVQIKQFNPNIKRILYSSRLYQQYGTDFLLTIINHYKNSTVKFVITDFFANKNESRKRLDPKTEEYRNIIKECSNVIIYSNGDNRQIYRDEIVSSASVVLGPYRKNANWSMGMLDAFAFGIPGIGPNLASFPEFTPRELLYSDLSQAIKLLDCLMDNEKFWNYASVKCYSSFKQFAPQKIAELFLHSIQKL